MYITCIFINTSKFLIKLFILKFNLVLQKINKLIEFYKIILNFYY